MLRYYYKNPYGYYTHTVERDGKKVKFKNHILHGNCLWVEMYFYKQEEDGKMVDMEQLCGFWSDLDHIKRAMKGYTIYQYDDDFVFYAEEIEGQKDIWKAIQILAKLGKKITIKSKKRSNMKYQGFTIEKQENGKWKIFNGIPLMEGVFKIEANEYETSKDAKKAIDHMLDF